MVELLSNSKVNEEWNIINSGVANENGTEEP